MPLTLSDEQDPPLQQNPWVLVGILVAVAVSGAGWWLAWRAAGPDAALAVKVWAFALLVSGSALIVYGLVRLELDERHHLRRRRERRDERRAA